MNILSATRDRVYSRSALHMHAHSGGETGTNLLYALRTASFLFCSLLLLLRPQSRDRNGFVFRPVKTRWRHGMNPLMWLFIFIKNRRRSPDR